MKQLLFTLLTFISINAFSQSKTLNNNPVYFLDSVRVTTLGIFDPNKIDNINVVREKDPTAPNGKIFITSKNPESFNFLSAHDIAKANNIPAKTISIFMLDNEVIKDTATFKIDSSYILRVDIIKASEIKYLPHNIPSLVILKIITATKDNIDKQNTIRIRGQASND